MLSIAKTSKRKFMKNETFLMRMMLNVQMGGIVMLTMYLIKNGHDNAYVVMFSWFVCKWIVSIVFDICFVGWYLVYRKWWMCLKRSVDMEDVREMIPNEFIEMEEKDAIN